eukprot:GHUV01017161.1.p1 GENE.GHUV01017161.1~~GHUV01017161.1.p1  ORF type:complete len:126 (+),score=25.26 GHUV01017161.1:439-816(+)
MLHVHSSMVCSHRSHMTSAAGNITDYCHADLLVMVHRSPPHTSRQVMYVVQTILTADVGDGHRAGVHSLTVLGQYMFSGDRAGTLKVGPVQTCMVAHYSSEEVAHTLRQRSLAEGSWCLLVVLSS